MDVIIQTVPTQTKCLGVQYLYTEKFSVIILVISFIITCDKPHNNMAKYNKFLVIHGL